MRNAFNKILALGLCAFSLTTAGSAADKQKIQISQTLDWLALRTAFASSDGLPFPDIEANLRGGQVLGIEDQPSIYRKGAAGAPPLRLGKASLTEDRELSDATAFDKRSGGPRVTGSAGGNVSGR